MPDITSHIGGDFSSVQQIKIRYPVSRDIVNQKKIEVEYIGRNRHFVCCAGLTLQVAIRQTVARL